MLAARATNALLKSKAGLSTSLRFASTAAEKDKYKIVVVGAGSGGLTVANQIFYRFKAAGKPLNEGDIVVVDGADSHYYQPGWTLVSSGLLRKEDTRKDLSGLIPRHLAHIKDYVKSFQPESNCITTNAGRKISYDSLVVSAGLKTNWDGIEGLPKALADPSSGVSSIYSYDTCDKVWRDIEALRSGKAVFTQPAGVIKCGGAPQKILWMAWDRFRKTGRGDQIKVDFYTATPAMFAVKKYSDALNQLRIERGVGGFFQHNLVKVDTANRKATFKNAADNSDVTVDYTLLHATPPMGPMDFIKGSPIADEAGWVAVDPGTLQSTKFSNVWSLGDASSAPTSKTAAAVTSEAPILTENLFTVMDTGKVSGARYDGYTSCPLLTGYGELMLAEFKYGAEPKETFGQFPFIGDQSKPNRLFYHFKKDLFPWAYWNFMIKGKWFGPSGTFRPKYSPQ
ncbi:uncharacterized protein PHACADRAFT_120746 [Phanerochaete carnosa HHB-10118-sp]|uniref:Sulfide:quinone oxidoreductase, mitochondrial n=1 Tax=Phanerochaete carnosa (strain HHB-10118-sp) TaxID=650164 RepID=K5WY33_PHACS|nr:uncharacterized protein PHACADRAFT_120746 [Phanerochaete carnosa HHB-10118-sp]EKM55392.1 hypothetical protein PHACADRAFT_120746 [Phanerochaete carnosa HHB-10118-sp]